MHPTYMANVRLLRHENDGDATFDFTTVDGKSAGFSRTAGGFVRFDDPTGDIYFDFIGEVKLLFAEWSHRSFFGKNAMRELTGEGIDTEERDRLQLEALNARLAEEDTGLSIDAWDSETGVFTSAIA